MKDTENIAKRILSLQGAEKVLFIILYGSYSKGTERPGSDIDICIYHSGQEEERAEFRFRALAELDDERIDIHTYQDLPIFIKKDIFKGKLLFCRDITEASDIAYRDLREYEDFKPRYMDYIGMEALQ